MQEVENKTQVPPKRPFIFYAIIAGIIIMLLNVFLFPSVMQPAVTEVGYDEFLDMIDQNQVTEVAYDEYNGEFVFVCGTDKEAKYYKTGIWPDDGQRLLQQLQEHPDIKFSASIPTQTNPLLSFLLTWILPVIFFFLLGELSYHWMKKRMKDQLPGGMGGACLRFHIQLPPAAVPGQPDTAHIVVPSHSAALPVPDPARNFRYRSGEGGKGASSFIIVRFLGEYKGLFRTAFFTLPMKFAILFTKVSRSERRRGNFFGSEKNSGSLRDRRYRLL